jgi:hypothetical protein
MIIGLHSINLWNGDIGFFAVISTLGCFIFYVVFCGSIFAQDQKNNSFRFLSRCGISARDIWWSRILPFLTISLPCGVVLIGNLCLEAKNGHYSHIDGNLYFVIPVFVAIWLLPFAVGAFISIYCRSMIVSIALTGAVSALVFGWMLLGMTLCEFNPLWTTLPILLMLLVASRIYTTDWLRERQTRRSRLIPLLPLFITIVTILVAIPPVRIYSIPYVSLDELEILFAQSFESKGLTPEECKARFDGIRSRLSQPLGKDEVDGWGTPSSLMTYINFEDGTKSWYPNMWNDMTSWEHQKKICRDNYETLIKMNPSYEDFLMVFFEQEYRKTANGYYGWHLPNYIIPWERIRFLRKICWYYDYILKFYRERPIEDTLSENESRVRNSWRYHFERQFESDKGLFDQEHWYWHNTERNSFIRRVHRMRIELVIAAIKGWYLEHGKLPESLDELVGTYLTAIPTGIIKNEKLEYFPEKDEEQISTADRLQWDGHKLGWPYLQLGEMRYDLYFLPDYNIKN